MFQFLINYYNLLVVFLLSLCAPIIFIKLVLPKIRKALNNRNKQVFF